MDILHTLLILIFCHLVGDYVLQSNFLATTKGENWYHLFVHCSLCIVLPSVLYRIRYNLATCIYIHHASYH